MDAALIETDRRKQNTGKAVADGSCFLLGVPFQLSLQM